MLDEVTAAEIDKLVERLLLDLPSELPVRVDDVLELLKVDLAYYNLDDPGLIRRFVHRAKLKGQHVGEQIRAIRGKIKLHALWCPDESHSADQSA